MRSARPLNRGFTLVEIMVVVVIMAVIISIAVLAIGVTGRDTQLDEESRRLEGLIALLHDRALLEGRDFGLRIEPTAYEFVTYDTVHDRWHNFTDESQYRRRTLPPGVAFQLELDSQVVVLKPIDRDLIGDEPPPPPQVTIAASGEGTPFRLTLEREATHATAAITADALGKTTIVRSDHVEKPS
jgi:general secretion pathway protein H